MRITPEGRSPDQILANPRIDHSSWYFFQAVSWLDLAKRSKNPSALHYTAFELRYGIEYLLFELLVLTGNLTEPEYQKCVGDPKEMKKILQSNEIKKLFDFTRIAMSVTPNVPSMHFWDVGDLFKSWGIASEFLHFVGAQTRTYSDAQWFDRSQLRLEAALKPIWDASTKTVGKGLLARKQMPSEVQQLWSDYVANKIVDGELETRLRKIQEDWFKRQIPC